MVVIRVRTRDGVQRVDMDERDTLFTLKTKVAALASIAPAQVVLTTDPAGRSVLQNESRTLQQLNIKHGDMVHLVQQGGSKEPTPIRSTPPPPSQTASSDSPSSSVGPSPSLTPRCTHPPHATCINCLPSSGDAAPEGKKKCLHGPNTTCPNCMTSASSTGKKIPWLCQHAAGAKCSNCIKIRKKDKTAKKPCTHPSNMVCANCADEKLHTGESENGTPDGAPAPKPEPGAKPLGPPQKLTQKCKHGPRGACDNCMPAEDPSANGGISTGPRKCRNHGPHGSCIECLMVEEARKPKIKSQEYANVKAVSIDYSSANAFQQYLQSQGFSQRRVGYLYGTTDKDKTVKVEAIYEPPQRGTKEKFELLEDKEAQRVEQLAALLGYKPVGWIFSHPKRDYSMSNDEVLKAAELQAKYGNEFVTLVLFENKEGMYSFEAFQLSDQCTQLYKDGALLPSDNPKTTRTSVPVIVERADTLSVDNHLWIVTLPIKDHVGMLGSEFPIENRSAPVRASDLKVHLMRNHNKPYWQRLADFHLLLYLTSHLSLSTDMPVLCEAIRNKSVDQLEGFKLIINHLAGIND
mmetsp:Transcript_15404/g.25445  ORF Transcript_15404/g.25445 Transcript_15404/m.25445 type:complete len:576 (-) Transcript_15404:27-1754(-)|eukprot:CAMPEP_0184652128 /NCGR_PEP_ID=MMETSP0308-20130426/9804_1 /TAXON_ID=38269 /ORGANISM="Gloeochaete witrockiana, Strain SAG 46.84" /LENGTH=575 /DNA_ID=CAMNT_0027086809 /DNA_START=128 /DNA_END=1855 /DNA_ORIENTATION=+